MLMREFREYDPVTGITSTYRYGGLDTRDPGDYHLHRIQDVGPTLEYTRHLESYEPDHSVLLGPSRRRHIAEIPPLLWEQLYQEKRTPAQDLDGFKAWLNAPENQVFRVWRGTV